MLLDVQSMQVKDSGEFYAGTFPSYRECGGAPHNYQPDNNIFYTAVSAFALRNMLPYLMRMIKQLLKKLLQHSKSLS